MKSLFAILAAIFMLLVAGHANAHGMRTAYIEITALSAKTALVHVNTASRLEVTLDGCEQANASEREPTSSVFQVTCRDEIANARVRVAGLGPIMSEAAIWITLADGTTVSELATAAQPTFVIVASNSRSTVFEYVRLGLVHIATGVDHLLFLAALALALRNVRAVLLAETAFTISHTVSFTASTLGWVHVSPLAAEACIALSLVLAAKEIAPNIATRAMGVREGAALAFVFGLVHGLGFAGGLSDIGLPAKAIPSALVGFACGVEIGQVAFLAAMLGAMACLRGELLKRKVSVLLAYAIGASGAYLAIERLVAIFHSA